MTRLSKVFALIGISILSFTGFLDVTIVSTALPNMQMSLKMSVTELQWVMNACFLGISAFMASMGRVADIYGRRKIFYIGAIIFGLSSLGAGLSTIPFLLILFRAIQGVTIAITIPVAIALVQTLFEKEKIAKAMGVYGTITGAGLALGPVVGGALVTAFGWPSVFFVNIPFVIIGFLFCLPTLKESRSSTKMNLDYFGLIFLVLTISSLVFAVIEANHFGWYSPFIIGSAVVFIFSLICLIFAERHVAYPIMAPYLFKNPVFIPCMIFAFVGGGLMAVVLFINPLYLHLILNQSIWMTGVFLFIISIVVVLSSPFIGYLNHQMGPKKMIIAGAIFYLITVFGHLFFSAHFNVVLLTTIFILFGLGWAIVNQVPAVALGRLIHGDHLSVALGALFSFFNIGAAVLLAISVTFFHLSAMRTLSRHFNNINAKQMLLLHQFVNQPDQMQKIITEFSVLPTEKTTAIFENAFMHGLHAMFFPLIFSSVIALLLVVLMMSTAPNQRNIF